MNCKICGKPSGYFPLCKTCLKLKESGEVLKCPVCNEWRKRDDSCPNCGNKPIKVIDLRTTKKDNETNTASSQTPAITCLICGENSNGFHFCKSCYSKYKNRSIDIRITNCTETEILDEYGNLTYKCDDGRKVRSRAEAIICSWLYNNKIRVKYEEPVYYRDEETGETKELHPDFYLPDYELFIEYNELTNPKYIKSKEYTQKIYDKLGLKVIIMTDKDLQDISACLKPKLFIR